MKLDGNIELKSLNNTNTNKTKNLNTKILYLKVRQRRTVNPPRFFRTLNLEGNRYSFNFVNISETKIFLIIMLPN